MLLKVSRRDNVVKTLTNYYSYALDKKKNLYNEGLNFILIFLINLHIYINEI